MWLVQEIWAKIFSFNSPNSVTRVLPSFKQVVCFFTMSSHWLLMILPCILIGNCNYFGSVCQHSIEKYSIVKSLVIYRRRSLHPIFNWSVVRNFFWLKFVVQLPLTDIFKLFKHPHAELYQRGLLRLAPENSFYNLISAFFNATSRQQIYRIRAVSVRQTVKDEFYLVGFSVFHLLKFGWKQLGYFHHRKKEKITDNSQLVHSFLSGGWSGCYLCIFALHDLRIDFGYVQGRNRRNFRLLLRESLRHGVDRYGCGTLCSNRAFAEIRPCLHDRQKNISYYWGMLGISISIYRFEIRLASCRTQTFGCKNSYIRYHLHFAFCSVTNSASLDSTFSYPTNCSQTFSANENSHETS